MSKREASRTIDVVYRPVRTPKNYKSSKLILGTYRKIDLLYLVACCVGALLWALLNLTFFVPTLWSWVVIGIVPLQAIWLTSRHSRYHNNYESVKISAKFKRRKKTFYGYLTQAPKPQKRRQNRG